jgi:ketosteroid isomerase-like protein
MLTADYSRTDTVKTDTASTAQNVTGHCILAFKKQEDGSWKIARDIWN